MKILVCVKQVPDTEEIKIDPVTGNLIREGVPAILNPLDACALEAAVRLEGSLRRDGNCAEHGAASGKRSFKTMCCRGSR